MSRTQARQTRGASGLGARAKPQAGSEASSVPERRGNRRPQVCGPSPAGARRRKGKQGAELEGAELKARGTSHFRAGVTQRPQCFRAGALGCPGRGEEQQLWGSAKMPFLPAPPPAPHPHTCPPPCRGLLHTPACSRHTTKAAHAGGERERVRKNTRPVLTVSQFLFIYFFVFFLFFFKYGSSSIRCRFFLSFTKKQNKTKNSFCIP